MTIPHLPAPEKHPFDPFIPPRAKILILGSFPCLSKGGYGDWFYSSSGKNDLWRLLFDIYDMPVANRMEKEQLCQTHGIAMTDLGKVIARKGENTCADQDLMFREYNHQGIQRVLDSGITRILCTSQFVAREFEKQFSTEGMKVNALPSPSRSGSRALGRVHEYKQAKADGMVKDTYDYKLKIYRKALLK